ncbi:MAG: alcohol dehydrogenase catalytic domain-containing protein, partial [bacterium]
MKALYYDEPIGYQAIQLGELPAPEISDADVLVRVKAFSLNHLDVWVMSGSYPVKPPMPHIFGSDCSGVVEKAGKAVTKIKPGDEVIVHPGLSCGRCS